MFDIFVTISIYGMQLNTDTPDDLSVIHKLIFMNLPLPQTTDLEMVVLTTADLPYCTD